MNVLFLLAHNQGTVFFYVFFSSLAHYEANVSICLLTIIWYVILLAHYKKKCFFSFPGMNVVTPDTAVYFLLAYYQTNVSFCFAVGSSTAAQYHENVSSPFAGMNVVRWDTTVHDKKHGFWRFFSRSNKRFSSPRWNERGQVTHQYGYQVNVFSSLDRDLTTSLSLYLSLPFLYS